MIVFVTDISTTKVGSGRILRAKSGVVARPRSVERRWMYCLVTWLMDLLRRRSRERGSDIDIYISLCAVLRVKRGVVVQIRRAVF
jgi:hypothetical protein